MPLDRVPLKDRNRDGSIAGSNLTHVSPPEKKEKVPQTTEVKKNTTPRVKKKKKGLLDKAIDLLAALLRRPVIMIIIAVVILAAIVVGIVSCSNRPAKMSPELATSLRLAPMHPNDDNWTAKGQFKYYDDNNYTSILGIDVSEYNEDINWKKVKKAGIDFVIVRIGYRGYETGKFKLDSRFEEYLKKAANAGLFVGVYFVTQAMTEAEAVEEAELVLRAIEKYNITMPVYID